MERIARDLEVPRAEAFQRRDWLAQRVAAWVFGVVLAVASLGVLGGGPLADAEASGDGVGIRYQRFVRRSMGTEVVVRAETRGAPVVELELGGAYFRDADVELVWPRPMREAWSGSGVRLDVACGDQRVCEVRVKVKPRGAGRRDGVVRVNGQAVEFTVMVYP
jgi:hypothetical protein